ncbi:hypothetical protein BD289DRAFT_422983 [Coniella lustricola]|uniref:Uncharacterized protein n=1 Tax=Coniella lustricola TaxID=2025994 RepID=A0A2T3AK17_9PEZI|nr:hypothetical protein BD289DRAFT_422983 [Coniella lustricola]
MHTLDIFVSMGSSFIWLTTSLSRQFDNTSHMSNASGPLDLEEESIFVEKRSPLYYIVLSSSLEYNNHTYSHLIRSKATDWV